jgi:hypothetical protein
MCDRRSSSERSRETGKQGIRAMSSDNDAEMKAGPLRECLRRATL